MEGGGGKVAGEFVSTRWSVVLAAGGPRTPQSRAALETLFETYWTPLYAFARRKGLAAEPAQDAVQGFFGHLLEKASLDAADPERGRFRSFLLVSFKNWISNERERERAEKRGGGRRVLSFDEAEARLEPAHDATPERQFERDWALRLLERVLERLRAQYAARGQERLFEALKGHLVPGEAGAHDEVARALHLQEGAVRVAAHRLRERYRRLLREEILETVGDPARVEDEIRDLFAALAP
jgi:RNA polymerase sigma-70 factor (ECF subfamily)